MVWPFNQTENFRASQQVVHQQDSQQARSPMSGLYRCVGDSFLRKGAPYFDGITNSCG